MRSPGVIYRRYRQLRRKLLYEQMQQARMQCSENCIYGKSITYQGKDRPHIVRLCLFSLEKNGNNADLCSNAAECNAFVNKWSAELVSKRFEEEMCSEHTKRTKYPELAAYEWVLDKSLTEAKQKPTITGRILVWVINLLENLLKYVSGPRKRLMIHE